jgi:hypothetical protein
MTRIRYVCLSIMLMIMFLGASAWAAAISGTVTNNTGKSGRIYLRVNGSNNLGTSIAAAGSFTINGVQQGQQLSVEAFVDTQDTGVQHANDPRGTSVTVTAGTGTVSVGTFAVSLPTPASAQPPQIMVYPGDGGNFVMWDGARDDNGNPVAEKYTVAWSASATGSPVIGITTVADSGDTTFFAHAGVPADLYYQVTAIAGSTTAASGWVQVGAASGTGRVTGRVYFPGVSVTGPLFVALVQHSSDGPPDIRVAAVQTPVSGGYFTANNVPAGTYEIYPFLDLNNNGAYDAGDVGFDDGQAFSTTVTVNGSAVSAPDITLPNADVSSRITTNHGRMQWGEWYNLNLELRSLKKRAVKVQITSGPQLSAPIDVAMEGKSFNAWIGNISKPTVGDTYQVKVSYADGTSATIPTAVTGVLDSFPTPVAPVGIIPFDPTPAFSWQKPANPPAEYVYSIWLTEQNGNDGLWDAWAIPSSQTSLLYGGMGDVSQAQLTDGVPYIWNLSVTDANGNQASTSATFTATSAPALNGFSPVGGLPGTVVTITGANFPTDTSQYTVLFKGVPAAVNSATPGTLTVTVPVGAATGKIQVNVGGNTLLSANSFTVAAPVKVTGTVKTSSGVAVAGAKVENTQDFVTYGNTVTGADGSFVLDQIFQPSVAVKISKEGYLPTYTPYLYVDSDRELGTYHLYGQQELSGLGLKPGYGVVVGQVLNSESSASPVGGAIVTAASSNNGSYYTVKYFDGAAFGGSSTWGNGIFMVPNVTAFDNVSLTAIKSPWSFQYPSATAHADGVSEVAIVGWVSAPWFSGVNPASGKPGTSVTISGGNFSPLAAENLVKFNGIAAVVTAATTDSLTVTVPSAATSGSVTVTTAGGTASWWSYTVRNTLTAAVTGSGGALGTLTSIPGGISCRSTLGCSAEFDQGTMVELIATADGGALLKSFSGACTGNGACSFRMDGDKSVTASFAALQYLKKGSDYFSLLKDAFAAAVTGDVILAQAQLFTDSALYFNRPAAQVKLKGGYDSSFSSNSGFTTVDGRLNILSGTLKVEKVKIR